MKKLIYLDNAATTKTAPEVVEAMLPYFTEHYGNASAVYGLGQESKEAINKARAQIAQVLGAKENEIYFTAGGSESDNWALKAAAEAYAGKGKQRDYRPARYKSKEQKHVEVHEIFPRRSVFYANKSHKRADKKLYQKGIKRSDGQKRQQNRARRTNKRRKKKP